MVSPDLDGPVADRTTIAVIGGSAATKDDERLAEAVGAALGRAGAVLVCGGRDGVMEAACRGAQGAGGFTIGILMGKDRSEANPYLDVAIPTGLGDLRNALVARAGRAVIAIGGEYGTLSEIAFALKAGIPVIGLGTWEVSRPGLDVDPIKRVDDPEEAVRLALDLADG